MSGMTFKEFFDKYLWCGKLDSLEKSGCGAADWTVLTCKAYPPFIKVVKCRVCREMYTVVITDLVPKKSFAMNRAAVDRLRKLGMKFRRK